MTIQRYDNGLAVFRPPKPASVGTPGFHEKLRNGDPLPVTHWNREIITGEPSRYTYRYEVQTRSNRFGWSDWRVEEADVRNTYYDRTPVPVSHPSTNSMLVKAYGSAKTMAWDVGTFALEANKTYDLVRNAKVRTHERVLNILNARRRTIRTFEEFASAWLEYRYGWRILNYDLESAVESVDRFASSLSYDRYSVGDVQEETVEIPEVYNRLNYGGINFHDVYVNGSTTVHPAKFRSNRVVKHTKSVKRVGVGVEVDRSLAGFTINPILTAWEIVPYSFVIDWFVDVGSFLSYITPTLGRSFAWGWESTRTETTFKNYDRFHGLTWNDYSRRERNLVTTTDPGDLTVVKYSRSPIDGLSLTPSISIKPDLSLPKFADLAALAVSRRNPVARI